MKIRSGICLAGLLSVGILGCGGGGGVGASLPDVVEASGVVTLDGKPLDGATVVFRPTAKGHAATAISDSDGEFYLRTGNQEGAVVGSYNVTVTKKVAKDVLAGKFDPGEDSEHHEEAEGDTIQEYVNVLPAKYSSAQSSGIKKEIPADGTDELKVELTN